MQNSSVPTKSSISQRCLSYSDRLFLAGPYYVDALFLIQRTLHTDQPHFTEEETGVKAIPVMAGSGTAPGSVWLPHLCSFHAATLAALHFFHFTPFYPSPPNNHSVLFKVGPLFVCALVKCGDVWSAAIFNPYK